MTAKVIKMNESKTEKCSATESTRSDSSIMLSTAADVAKVHVDTMNVSSHFPMKLASETGEAVASLPAEVDDEGNEEYKLHLVDVSPERMEKLVTQMKWRIGEGQGEARYMIGVQDSGSLSGISEAMLEKSLATLWKMAEKCAAKASLLVRRRGESDGLFCAEVLVREERQNSTDYIDVRVAVVGNVDSGKSTLIGVLIKGDLDNGRGKMRAKVFNHHHELESGRTSSISQQIIGFDASGEIVNYRGANHHAHAPSWSTIVDQSAKVVTLTDLAGHEKYLKTTVSGMTGQIPDYCLLLVGANMGVQLMTREHLAIALALRIPLVVVLTKIDIAPENVMKATIDEIKRLLKVRGVRKITYRVKNDEDVVSAAKHFDDSSIVPMFHISSVTGTGVDLLRKFLNLSSPRIDWTKFADKPADVIIDESFFVQGVGTVVGGTVLAGRVEANGTYLLGPDSLGQFQPVQLRSIHKKRCPVGEVHAGDAAAFALRKVKRAFIRKGMSLLDPALNPQSSWEFEADVVILYHSTTIGVNYEPVIQCLTIRQTAKIVSMNREVMRTGDKARIRLQFKYRPEYLRAGLRLVFREGKTKGRGVIREVFPGQPKTVSSVERGAKKTNPASKEIDATSSSSSSSLSQKTKKKTQSTVSRHKSVKKR